MAATLPAPVAPVAPVVCAAGGLTRSDWVASDLALSEMVARCAASAACARAGKIDAGISSTSAATAGTARAVTVRKGQRQLINAGSSILLGWLKVSRFDYKLPQCPAKAILDTLRKC